MRKTSWKRWGDNNNNTKKKPERIDLVYISTQSNTKKAHESIKLLGNARKLRQINILIRRIAMTHISLGIPVHLACLPKMLFDSNEWLFVTTLIAATILYCKRARARTLVRSNSWQSSICMHVKHVYTFGVIHSITHPIEISYMETAFNENSRTFHLLNASLSFTLFIFPLSSALSSLSPFSGYEKCNMCKFSSWMIYMC